MEWEGWVSLDVFVGPFSEQPFTAAKLKVRHLRRDNRSCLQDEDYILKTNDYKKSTGMMYIKSLCKRDPALSSISSACWSSRVSALEIWGEVENGSERYCKCDSRSRRDAIPWQMWWARSGLYGQGKLRMGFDQSAGTVWEQGHEEKGAGIPLAGGTGSFLSCVAARAHQSDPLLIIHLEADVYTQWFVSKWITCRCGRDCWQ